MASKRRVEVFSSGCGLCDETVEMVKRAACPSCEVIVHDMKTIETARRARALGIRSVPAVVIDSKLPVGCEARGVDEASLREAGLGTPL